MFLLVRAPVLSSGSKNIHNFWYEASKHSLLGEQHNRHASFEHDAKVFRHKS